MLCHIVNDGVRVYASKPNVMKQAKPNVMDDVS